MAEDVPYEKLPFLSKICLPTGTASIPSFCVAARSPIDDAAAIMLGQLSTSHGIAARVEAAKVLSIANVFQLETAGVAIVCLIYMDQTAQLTRVTPFDVLAVNWRSWMKNMDPGC